MQTLTGMCMPSWFTGSKQVGLYVVTMVIGQKSFCTKMFPGTVLIVMVWLLDLQLLMQSVPITTNVLS